MSVKKRIGIISLAVGLVFLALSLLADFIGIGAMPGFGPAQITGVVVAVIVTGVGLLLTFKN